MPLTTFATGSVMNDIPFLWSLRVSKRAQRPRLTINHTGRVELVWPIDLPQSDVLSMLQQHQDWVLKHLQQVPQRKQQVFPPSSICFQATGQTWHVHYQQLKRGSIGITEQGSALYLRGDIQNHQLLCHAMRLWVKRQGVNILKPWLFGLAEIMDVSFQSLSVRLQKKRWGSCSAGKRINLNAALLFVPDFLVKHVLIHELAHLHHMNHSASFWARVRQYDMDYEKHRKLLPQYATDVPFWLTEACDADACQVK